MSSYRAAGPGSDLTSPLHSPRINSPRSRRMVHPYPDALTSPPFHSTEPSYFSSTLRSSITLGVQLPKTSLSTSPGQISPSIGDQSPSVTLNFGQLSISSSTDSPTFPFPPSGAPSEHAAGSSSNSGSAQVPPPRVRSASLTRPAFASPPTFNRKGSANLKRKGGADPFSIDSEMTLVQDSAASQNYSSLDETKPDGFSMFVPIPAGVNMQPQAPSTTSPFSPPTSTRAPKTSRKSSSDVKSLSPGRANSGPLRSSAQLKKSASSVALATSMSQPSLSASKSSAGSSSGKATGIPSPPGGDDDDDEDSPPAVGDEGQKKGPWLQEEDAKLMALVESHGPKDWSYIAQQMPGRIGKQCRERYFNHLAPDVRKEAWTPEEDEAIIRYHSTWGNKWTLIARVLSNGRPPNAIKNRWNSSLKKRAEAEGTEGRFAGAQSPPSPSTFSAVPPLPPPPAKKDKEKAKNSKERASSQQQQQQQQQPQQPQKRQRKPRAQTQAPVQQTVQASQVQLQGQTQQTAMVDQQNHLIGSPSSSSSADSTSLDASSLIFPSVIHPIIPSVPPAGTDDMVPPTSFEDEPMPDNSHASGVTGYSPSMSNPSTSPSLPVEGVGGGGVVGSSGARTGVVAVAGVLNPGQIPQGIMMTDQQQQQQLQQQQQQQPIQQDAEFNLPPPPPAGPVEFEDSNLWHPYGGFDSSFPSEFHDHDISGLGYF